LVIIPLGSAVVQSGFATNAAWAVRALTRLQQGDPKIAEHKADAMSSNVLRMPTPVMIL
jgi:hypothetical protein